MRTATFLLMSALGMACAHQAAQPPAEHQAAQLPAERQAALTVRESKPEEPRVSSAPSKDSGDPRLGTLELASQPGAPRAEVGGEGDSAAKALLPRPIEPEAPKVATTPPASDLPATAAPGKAATREEIALRERVQNTLAHETSLSFTARRVRIEVEKDRVTLLGEVRTAREKNEVEDLVQKVSGVRRVKNQLAVMDQTPRDDAY